jgi:sulfite exporter TauE/SafE
MENASTSFITVFLTGLLTGGLTCLAVQGGLLAATIAEREQERLKEKTTKGAARPILAFLIAKLIAYSILGLFLGWLGSVMQLSLSWQLILQFAVAIFMVGTALNLLNVHPFFRHFAIQPPRFLTRLIKNQTKSKDIFAPALLGAFTVFIPCGTTQAFMALAIASGSPLRGLAIMYAFILGTMPVFFVLGYTATKLGDFWHKKFMRVAALAIIILALFNTNNAIALTGSRWTFGNTVKAGFCSIAYCDKEDVVAAQGEDLNINIESGGYSPKNLSVKAGSTVKLHLKNIDNYSCAQAFTIPSLRLQKIVPPGEEAVLEFTAPKQKGELAFMCSMGMYRGVININ